MGFLLSHPSSTSAFWLFALGWVRKWWRRLTLRSYTIKQSTWIGCTPFGSRSALDADHGKSWQKVKWSSGLIKLCLDSDWMVLINSFFSVWPKISKFWQNSRKKGNSGTSGLLSTIAGLNQHCWCFLYWHWGDIRIWRSFWLLKKVLIDQAADSRSISWITIADFPFWLLTPLSQTVGLHGSRESSDWLDLLFLHFPWRLSGFPAENWAARLMFPVLLHWDSVNFGEKLSQSIWECEGVLMWGLFDAFLFWKSELPRLFLSFGVF